jgi:hypothetical protein
MGKELQVCNALEPYWTHRGQVKQLPVGDRTLIMKPLSVFPVILRSSMNSSYSLFNVANDTVLKPAYRTLNRRKNINMRWIGREVIQSTIVLFQSPASVCDWGQWDNKNFSLNQGSLLEQPKEQLLKWDDQSVNTSIFFFKWDTEVIMNPETDWR